jgi:hypothetical protein
VRLYAAMVSVKTWSTLARPRTITWRIGPMDFLQPKHCSMHFLLSWLIS